MDDTQKYEETCSFSNDTVVSNDSAEPSTTLFTMPQTEEEMRHCKHCEFQAEDWPAFSKHVFTQSHLMKIAPAYNIRLSKDQVSSTFTCEVCIVECKGHKPWVAHLLGAKHRKALEQVAITKAEQKSQALKNRTGGGPVRNTQYGNIHNKRPYDRVQNATPKPSNVPSLAARDFAQYPEPLIGLEYLTEIQVAGQNPRYECSVCNMKFDHNLKFSHLVGQKHRLSVLKIKRPEVVRGAASKKRSEVTSILMRESAILESEEGRQQVKTKVQDPPFKFNAEYSPVNASGRGSTRGTRGNRGGRGLSRGNTSLRGASHNIGTFQPRGGYNMRQPTMSHNYDSFNSSYDSSYDTYHNDSLGMTNNSRFDYSSNNRNYVESNSYAYPEQAYSGSGHAYLAPPSQIPYSDSGNIPRNESNTKGGATSGLANALGDLTKLVQNEEDASVALQVSNALTQALLQYRMGNEAIKE